MRDEFAGSVTGCVGVWRSCGVLLEGVAAQRHEWDWVGVVSSSVLNRVRDPRRKDKIDGLVEVNYMKE
jgi:hypothetical protein